MSLTSKLAFFCLLLVMLGATFALAEDTDQTETRSDFGSLATFSDQDTVRTNIWLAEALMAKAISRSVEVLPPAPAAIRLENRGQNEASDLFQIVVANILGSRGYDLYLADEEPAREGAVEYIFGYNLQSVRVDYPEVGRSLGIWRQWVARDLKLNAQIEISEADSGRLLFNDNLELRFSDRIPSDDFDAVNSSLYSFATEEVAEAGWRGRVEEIVVLGTLVGLISVYFANTNN